MELEYRFKKWVDVYQPYLIEMFYIMRNNLDKEMKKNNIEFRDFCVFAFNHSSQYISPYA